MNLNEFQKRSIEIIEHYYDGEIPLKTMPLLVATINADEKELRESISAIICLR